MKHVMKVLVIGFLWAFTSCSDGNDINTAVSQRKPKTNIVLIDLSESRDTSVIAWYKKVIVENILPHIGPKDNIVILPIDAGSRTASTEILAVDFAKNNYKNEFAGLDAEDLEAASHKDSIAGAIAFFKVAFDRIVGERRQFNNGTDIVGAFLQATKYYRFSTDNLLIVLSDMLLSDKTIDLEKALVSGNESETSTNLNRLEKVNFQGMKILVLTGVQPTISAEKYSIIECFWKRYFLQCNDSLIDYSSGAISNLDKIIQQ